MQGGRTIAALFLAPENTFLLHTPMLCKDLLPKALGICGTVEVTSRGWQLRGSQDANPPLPPPRGLRPIVSCQSYEPKEPTGAEGAPAPKARNGVM